MTAQPTYGSNIMAKNGLFRRTFTISSVLGLFGLTRRKVIHAQDLETYGNLGFHQSFDTERAINNHSMEELLGGLSGPKDTQYNLCAEGYPSVDTPREDSPKHLLLLQFLGGLSLCGY